MNYEAVKKEIQKLIAAAAASKPQLSFSGFIWEIQSHGGALVVRRILELALQNGAVNRRIESYNASDILFADHNSSAAFAIPI